MSVLLFVLFLLFLWADGRFDVRNMALSCVTLLCHGCWALFVECIGVVAVEPLLAHRWRVLIPQVSQLDSGTWWGVGCGTCLLS